MSTEQAEVGIQTLIELGKAQGFLTYDEINDLLPDDMSVPEKLDELLATFEELGIEVVDESAEV